MGTIDKLHPAEDYATGRVSEVGVRFIRHSGGTDGQLQLFKRGRDGFYVLSRVFSHHGHFTSDEVEILLAMTIEHARLHLEMTSGIQLTLSVD